MVRPGLQHVFVEAYSGPPFVIVPLVGCDWAHGFISSFNLFLSRCTCTTCTKLVQVQR